MRWRAWHASGSSITLHRRRHQLRERTDEIGRHNFHHASLSFKEDLKQFLVAQHRVFAVERLGLLSRPHFHSSLAELIDYYLIAGVAEKVVDALSHHGTDLRHSSQFFEAGASQATEIAEIFGKFLRSTLADVRDAESVDQAP